MGLKGHERSVCLFLRRKFIRLLHIRIMFCIGMETAAAEIETVEPLLWLWLAARISTKIICTKWALMLQSYTHFPGNLIKFNGAYFWVNIHRLTYEKVRYIFAITHCPPITQHLIVQGINAAFYFILNTIFSLLNFCLKYFLWLRQCKSTAWFSAWRLQHALLTAWWNLACDIVWFRG